jgi:hypothetical protein
MTHGVQVEQRHHHQQVVISNSGGGQPAGGALFLLDEVLGGLQPIVGDDVIGVTGELSS